jgi:hypothetical protein
VGSSYLRAFLSAIGGGGGGGLWGQIQRSEPEFVNVSGAQESIKPACLLSIPWLLKLLQIRALSSSPPFGCLSSSLD